MQKRHCHVAVEIAKTDTRTGHLLHVITNHDNRACVLLYGERNGGFTKVVFKGKTVMETDGAGREPLMALHPEGDRLAVCRGLPGDSVFVYGISGLERTYRNTENFSVHHLEWLPHGRIVWNGFESEENVEQKFDGNSTTNSRTVKTTWRCFANGEDVTGKLDFMQVITYGGKQATNVCEDGLRYTVLDDGSRCGYREDCCDSFLCSHGPDREETGSRPAKAEMTHVSSKVQVTFSSHVGPLFDGIHSHGIPPQEFSYNSDRSRVGYVGTTFTKPAGFLISMGNQVARYVPPDNIMENPFLAWPMAVLLNPYFGPLYWYFEKAAKRFNVVDHDKVWGERLRRPPSGLFYTAFNELVAVIREGGGYRLVIDERPGPKFDWITNARNLEQDGRICYAAKRGDKIFRVTA